MILKNRKLTKKVKKELRRIAKSLPDTYDIAYKYRYLSDPKTIGSFMPTPFNIVPIIQDPVIMNDDRLTMKETAKVFVKINHKKRLAKAYLEEGLPGIEKYKKWVNKNNKWLNKKFGNNKK